MLIGEGKLFLSNQMPDSHLHLPIDIFFRSLAEDQQHKAIGIVLSGTGSDGTRGIKAMKESGGLVIVQQPGSAKFDGMPMSAFNTGLADLLLAPEEMGENIVKFISHPSISGDELLLKQSINENDATLMEMFEMLKRKSSINFSQYKASTVARRIERRLGINQLTSLESYLRLLNDSPRELQTLSKELLIGVTRFFRDDDVFLKLASTVIPKIADEAIRKNESIRVWVAGCSSGEEAYSLAILFDEYLKKHNADIGLTIFATDVDEDAIAEASAGRYSIDICQDFSETRLNRYFHKTDDSYVVTPELRKMIIFASHNMIDDPPFSNIDLVSCRNVLIYFQHAAQKKVLSSLYFSLQRNGYLLLGSSESLGELQLNFETIFEREKIYLKTSNIRVPISNTPPLRDMAPQSRTGMSMAPVSSLLKTNRPSAPSHLEGAIERLLSEYAPDSIVLDDTFQALHVYGDVKLYLKGIGPGKISNNIKDMVCDELSVAVSTALSRCEKEQEDVYYKDLAISITETETIEIDLSIFFIRDRDNPKAPHYYIIQFIRQRDEQRQLKSSTKVSFNVSEQARQRIKDLEQELVKKQEHLQITVEELETTNEELQSANEELMSANEELQSTNEELQSVNEELYTVNSEYQEKIGQLTEANNDLDSVISATDIGIIFLDEQLCIRKFTPSASTYVHLRTPDIGRPFHHISHELVYTEFLADIANVSSNGAHVERHVSSQNGHTASVRIMPYRSSNDSQQDGVLITITNISRQRFVESALQRAQDQLRNSLLDRAERLHRHIMEDGVINVLLLDDDSVDRKRVSKMLTAITDRKFDIRTFAEIDEAAQAATKQSFDICLVDYQLAGGTAKDFTEQIREANVQTPVVILSGYSETGLDSEFLNTDTFDFLNKDELSSQLLVRSIDYVIEKKSLQEAIEELKV